MASKEQLLQRKEEIEKSLETLKEILVRKNGHLKKYEYYSLKRVVNNENTLLNPKPRGQAVNYMMLLRQMYEMETNISRRMVFYIRKRRRKLIDELGKIKKELEDREMNEIQPESC